MMLYVAHKDDRVIDYGNYISYQQAFFVNHLGSILFLAGVANALLVFIGSHNSSVLLTAEARWLADIVYGWAWDMPYSWTIVLGLFFGVPLVVELLEKIGWLDKLYGGIFGLTGRVRVRGDTVFVPTRYSIDLGPFFFGKRALKIDEIGGFERRPHVDPTERGQRTQNVIARLPVGDAVTLARVYHRKPPDQGHYADIIVARLNQDVLEPPASPPSPPVRSAPMTSTPKDQATSSRPPVD